MNKKELEAKARSWEPTSIEDTREVAKLHLKLYGIEYDSDGASSVSRKIATYETAKTLLSTGLPEPEEALKGIQATLAEVNNLKRLEGLYFKTVQEDAKKVASVIYQSRVDYGDLLASMGQALVNYNAISGLRRQLEAQYQQEQAYASSNR